MRKRDLQRLLDEQEAENALLRAQLDTARAVAEDAHRVIDKLAAEPAEHGWVRLHQDDGKPTLEGVLVAREPQYVLRNAAMLEAEGRTIDLDGTVEVPRAHVAFVQLLGSLAESD